MEKYLDILINEKCKSGKMNDKKGILGGCIVCVVLMIPYLAHIERMMLPWSC